CQMNKSDSDIIALSLVSAGYDRTDDQKNADIIIFNTCSVRKNAEDRAIARLTEASNRRPVRPMVIVAGCLAQHIGKRLIDEGICNIAVGPYQSPELPSLICAYLEDSTRNLHTSVQRDEFAERLPRALVGCKTDDYWHRWVTITHGCENFCTYCIVPFVRGPLLSFPSSDILDFIRRLPDEGVIEVSLLGQNVNQYGQDSGDIPFYSLLERASSVPGIEKVNFLTSHPKDLDDNIIRVMAENQACARALHLPLQSGSDNILHRMNRSYDFSHYMSIVEKLNTRGTFSLTTDIIVGFPGETDDDFKMTLDAVREIGYDDAYMYAYSPREGTESADYDDHVPDDVKAERLRVLIDTQRKMGAQKISRYIGMKSAFIAERISKRNEAELSGKTMLNHQAVVPGGADLIGTMNEITITDIRGATLYGTIQ
ncbi:MAG: tRNA (N6-isopentenyl adenosine(37)-C2)-methylthiotransferase MiaB, partial [Spirochaetota bacterium]